MSEQNAVTNSSVSSRATNTSSDALKVVCAWPVSGQYGAGTRFLYYVLVATCVVAKNSAWLRQACLAAALLFPAIAALHGIVLAALHNSEAVDMDIYGALQLCSIGILAGPATVRLSSTYWNNPGRNIIFLWTVDVLAGLLSLTVEFFRTAPSRCTHDNAGNSISSSHFPYGGNVTCGLTCSIEQGPHSPLRGGSANNIYVIPAPDKITFGAATLFAAACCIPAILSLISMWNKILEINWRTHYGYGDGDEEGGEQIEGTMTTEEHRETANEIRKYLRKAEAPLFGGAVLTILIMGERNFFSTQVSYQTEPMASIGQWAPIAGTGFAAIGSLCLLLAADTETEAKTSAPDTPGDMGNHHRAPDGLWSITTRASKKIAGNITEWTKWMVEKIKSAGHYLGTAPKNWNDPDFRSGEASRYPQVPAEEHRNPGLPRTMRNYTANSIHHQ